MGAGQNVAGTGGGMLPQQQSLSGLGGFNPGGLGGPQINSPYWQPPAAAAAPPAASGMSAMTPGPAQQGMLMPAYMQPFLGNRDVGRFLSGSGPYRNGPSPYTMLQGGAGPGMERLLGALTPGVSQINPLTASGYVPLTGRKLQRTLF